MLHVTKINSKFFHIQQICFIQVLFCTLTLRIIAFLHFYEIEFAVRHDSVSQARYAWYIAFLRNITPPYATLDIKL